jgi:hypothetical protein
VATIDDIINGSFTAIGAPPSYITPAYNPADYASIYAPAAPRGNGMWGSTRPAITPRPAYSPYMTAAEKAQLEKQVAESKALQATMGKTPTAVATGPAWNQPTSMDLAAIEAQNRPAGTVGPTLDDLLAYAKGLPDDPAKGAVAAATGAGTPVTGVTGKMQPTSGGGLFDLLFGPSKNGMGGLAGLLGGPGAGGIFGMMGTPSQPRAPRAPNTYAPATSVSGNTGYRNERTGVLYTSDKGRQYGTSATGQRTDYGASPGQKTSGLKPGDRVYNSDTNSWELK